MPTSLRCEHCLAPQTCEVCGDTPFKPDSPLAALMYLPRGLVAVFTDAPLLRLSVMPLLLTTLILVGGLFFGFSQLMAYMAQWDYGPTVSNGIAMTLTGLLSVLGALVFFIFLFVPVSTLCALPFLDAISLRSETLILGDAPAGSLNWWALIPQIVVLFALKVGAFFLALPLLFLPVVGHALFFYILALLTGVDFLDIVLSRKGLSLKKKASFLSHNLLRFGIFSLPLTLMLWVPILQLLFIPAATVGAVHFVLKGKKPPAWTGG